MTVGTPVVLAFFAVVFLLCGFAQRNDRVSALNLACAFLLGTGAFWAAMAGVA